MRRLVRRIRGRVALWILGDIPCIANVRIDHKALIVWGNNAIFTKNHIYPPAGDPTYAVMQMRGIPLSRVTGICARQEGE